MAEADRVAEFKEVAVFLRRLRRRRLSAGSSVSSESRSTSAGCGGGRE
jgi:hypothetical protein